jgi:hypothetical protein
MIGTSANRPVSTRYPPPKKISGRTPNRETIGAATIGLEARAPSG